MRSLALRSLFTGDENGDLVMALICRWQLCT